MQSQTAATDIIRQAKTILSTPNIPESDPRLEVAATQLVGLRLPQSREVVTSVLANQQFPASQVAVARALADRPDPEAAQYVTPLFVMLSGSPRAASAASQAISTYKNDPVVLTRLIDIARGSGAGPAYQTDRARLAAISGLGGMIEKRAAATLMQLLKSANEGPGIRNASMDALGNLSGESRIQRDPQGWQRWWDSRLNQNDAQFRNDLMVSRANDAEAVQRRLAELQANVRNLVDQEYAGTPPADQPAKLLSYLSNPEAVIREEGAAILRRDKLEGKPISPDTLAQARKLIADPDPRVRATVASALVNLSDKDALQPLLDQLAREDDPGVRAALARALSPIKDIKAFDRLLQLLDDRDVVAQAAADALAGLLTEANPDQTLAAAGKLRQVFERANDPSALGLRESVVDAMSVLKDESLLDTYKSVLQSESVRLRAAAVRGIGNLGNPRSAQLIADKLKDEDPSVRFETVKSLQRIGAIEYAPQLFEMLLPRANETTAINAKAWDALTSFLPSLDEQTLQRFADEIKPVDSLKRIAILQQKADKEIKAKKIEDHARTLQNIGETQMDDAVGQFPEAAANFAQALTELAPIYTRPGNPTISSLSQWNLKAQLRAEKYFDAMAFVREWLKSDPTQIREVASIIKQEAERLKEAGKENTASLEKAIKLIVEANKLDLPQPYPDSFKQILDDIQQIQAKNKGSGTIPVLPDISSPRGGATARTGH